MSSSDPWIADAWITRIVAPIAIFISLWNIRKEIKSKQSQQQNQPEIAHSHNARWLNFWSLLTMILFTLQIFMNFVLKIPYLCLGTSYMIAIFWSLAQCAILMYMINRLQFSFSMEMVHNKHGYHKYTFYILYFIIIGHMIYVIARLWAPIIVIDLKANGCDIAFKAEEYIIMAYYLFAMLLFVHFLVLFMYIIKIIQIRFKFENMDYRVRKRLNFVLRKILILSLLYHAVQSFCLLAINLFWENNGISDYTPLISAMIMIWTSVFNTYLVFLMIERNNDQYEKFVERFKMKHLCCCLWWNFKRLTTTFDQPLIPHHENNQSVPITNNSHRGSGDSGNKRDGIYLNVYGMEMVDTQSFNEEPNRKASVIPSKKTETFVDTD